MPDFSGFSPAYSLPLPWSIRIGSKLLDLTGPKVMGILNVNEDSFFPGSRVGGNKKLLEVASNMLEEGADILDVGAISSRPGADEFTLEIELERFIPAIRTLRKEFPDALLSVDTFRSEVVKQAVSEGANIINDISGGSNDPNLWKTVAEAKVPYILMHSRGNFNEMHAPYQYQDLVVEVITELQNSISRAREAGITDIIADPGFGFSKNREQNFELLGRLSDLKMLDVPILAGISRKSMIYKTLDISVEDSLHGTTALNMVALQQGAHILRVHDVKEARQTITLFEKLCSQEL